MLGKECTKYLGLLVRKKVKGAWVFEISSSGMKLASYISYGVFFSRIQCPCGLSGSILISYMARLSGYARSYAATRISYCVGGHQSLLSTGMVWVTIKLWHPSFIIPYLPVVHLRCGLMQSGTLAIPNFSLLLWLVFRHRLLTKDRMIRFGMKKESICYLCNCWSETIKHLFLDCLYAEVVLLGNPVPMLNVWDDFSEGRFHAVSSSRMKNPFLICT